MKLREFVVEAGDEMKAVAIMVWIAKQHIIPQERLAYWQSAVRPATIVVRAREERDRLNQLYTELLENFK